MGLYVQEYQIEDSQAKQIQICKHSAILYTIKQYFFCI